MTNLDKEISVITIPQKFIDELKRIESDRGTGLRSADENRYIRLLRFAERLQAKIAERVDAMERISMLDYNNNAELLDAVKIAKAAITKPTEE